MKSFKYAALATLATILMLNLAACTPKIDCNNFEQSMQEMKESLPAEKQLQFQLAVAKAIGQNAVGILAAGIGAAALDDGDDAAKKAILKQACSVMDGMTADEIIQTYIP